VLFVGDSGTAKSVTISNYLGRLSPEQYLVLNMNFSSRTSSMDVQRSVEDAVEKRTKVSRPTAANRNPILRFEQELKVYPCYENRSELRAVFPRFGLGKICKSRAGTWKNAHLVVYLQTGQKVKVLVSYKENSISVSRVGVCNEPEQISSQGRKHFCLWNPSSLWKTSWAFFKSGYG
jgi:hypothetical protein